MSTATLSPPPPRRSPPPLQPGDRLSRDEFERRFDATPHLKKAELIEGVVYMAPPVNYALHDEPNTHLTGLFFVYAAATPGIRVGTQGSLRFDWENMPQPDALLLLDPKRGGQAKVADDGYIEGAPELIAEIAATTASYDLHQKMEVYRRHGVKEYIVWRTYDREFDFFHLRNSQYERQAPDKDGIYRSRVFPGLWINGPALLAAQLAAALQTVQQGAASPEHNAFVAQASGL
jgi:Uma2 family endonuclease